MRRVLAALAFVTVAACPGNTIDTGFTAPPPDGTIVTCPVSKERCEKTPLTPAAVYESKTYYFCCADCPRRFREDPRRFAGR